nr:hypothetical protein 114 [Pelagibacteraceae bacterium]
MTLERNQLTQNQVITAVGNNSESNDPQQFNNSMNNRLIASAERFAAGKTLGLSEEETLALMSRELRRQRRADDTVTMDDVQRKFAQSAASLVDSGLGAAEFKGVGLQEMPEVDPFGQSQDSFQEFGGSGATPAEARDEKVRLGFIAPSDMSEEEKMRMGEAVERPQSGRAGVADALRQLKAARAEQSGFSGMLSRVFGGGQESLPGAAGVEGRLEDSLYYGRDQRAAERDQVRLMNQADIERMNYRRAAYNNIMAQIEAENIQEEMYTPRPSGKPSWGAIADANLGAVRSGTPQFPMAGRAEFSVNGPVAPVGVGEQTWGSAIDERGNPIGAYGPEYVTPNTEPSALLNAPQTTRSWMVEKQPTYYSSDRSFGNYPQVDINGETAMFANRLRQLPGFENISSNVRGVDEVQRAVDIASRNDNITFATREPVTDAQGNVSLKSVRQAQPDVRGLLNALRYTPAEEGKLANALYMLETAKQTEINQNPGKQQYYTRTGPMGRLEATGMRDSTRLQTPGGAEIFFDSPEAVDPRDGAAPVARIAPGQKIDGKDIKTALGKLKDPDAARPFIGAVETVDRATGKKGVERNAGPGYLTRYNKTGADDLVGIESALRNQEQEYAYKRAKTKARRNPRAIVRPQSQQPVDEKSLRGKVVKAALVSEREKRDNAARADKMSTLIDNLPPNARQVRIR